MDRSDHQSQCHDQSGGRGATVPPTCHITEPAMIRSSEGLRQASQVHGCKFPNGSAATEDH
eukprot:146217-Hanusia_phi.AAC.1